MGNKVSDLGKAATETRTAINGGTVDFPAGSPVIEDYERLDGASVLLPKSTTGQLFPEELANFAGVLASDLPHNTNGDQTSELVVEGVTLANLLILPSAVRTAIGAPSAIAGTPLTLAVDASGNACLAPCSHTTGIVLLEDCSALAAGSYLVSAAAGKLVEIRKGVAGGPIRHFSWMMPAAANTTYYKAAVAGTVDAQTITDFTSWSKTVPDVPRNIVITTGGVTADVNVGTITVTGTNAAGDVITEGFAITENQNGATTGVKAFASITKVEIPAQDGAGATFDFGTGAVLGLGKCFLSRPAVVEALVNGARETTYPTIVADVDELEKNTVDFNTDPSGSVRHELVLLDC